MTKTRKLLIGGAVLAVVLILLLGGVGLWAYSPTQEMKLDALAAGAKRAVQDTDREYATAHNGKPAYYGYVLNSDFDFRDLKAHLGDVGLDILAMDQVDAVDWRKEEGHPRGRGPRYIYRRKDTGQTALVMTVKLIRCSRFGAEVRIEHDSGGAIMFLSRKPGESWQVKDAKYRQIWY